MDKNVLDKEEIHDMKIICEQDDATNIFEDLKCGDVFRLSHFKHDCISSAHSSDNWHRISSFPSLSAISNTFLSTFISFLDFIRI